MNEIYELIIIGAGISGIMAGHTLKKYGMNTLIIDKGKTVGGRLASKTVGNAKFDYGAQFFTSKSEEFKNITDELLSNNIARVWEDSIKEKKYTKYIGKIDMNSMVQYLSEGLNIIVSQNVKQINLTTNDIWEIKTEKEKVYYARNIMITSPVPQTLQLLKSGNFHITNIYESELEKIKYDSCISLTIETIKSNLPKIGYMKFKDKSFDWIADNYKKGISEQPNSITIHMSPIFSLENWDKPDNFILEKIISLASSYIGNEYSNYQIKKWKYSKPVNNYPSNYLILKESPLLILAGDGFGGPRVESAAISGIEAAKKVIKIL